MNCKPEKKKLKLNIDMNVNIKGLGGKTWVIQNVDPKGTVLSLKKRLQELNGCAPERQRLIYAGVLLYDTEILEDKQVYAETCIMFVENKAKKPFVVVDKPVVTKVVEQVQMPPPRINNYVPPPQVNQIPLQPPLDVDDNYEDVGPPPVDNFDDVGPPPVDNFDDVGPPPVDNVVADVNPPPIVNQPPIVVPQMPKPVLKNMGKLNIKDLRGRNFCVMVPFSSTFKRIKYDILEKKFGFKAIEMTLIYAGTKINDAKTPKDYNCQEDTCLHLVRTPGKSILSKEITTEGLKANCKYCHTPGAPLAIRPMCGTCLSEAVCVNNLKSIKPDSGTTWGDLEGCKGMCFMCNKNVSISWGFLCKAKVNGKSCPARLGDKTKGFKVRTMVGIYEGGGGEVKRDVQKSDSIVTTLNELYSYAQGGGFQDQVDSDDEFELLE